MVRHSGQPRPHLRPPVPSRLQDPPPCVPVPTRVCPYPSHPQPPFPCLPLSRDGAPWSLLTKSRTYRVLSPVLRAPTPPGWMDCLSLFSGTKNADPARSFDGTCGAGNSSQRRRSGDSRATLVDPPGPSRHSSPGHPWSVGTEDRWHPPSGNGVVGPPKASPSPASLTPPRRSDPSVSRVPDSESTSRVTARRSGGGHQGQDPDGEVTGPRRPSRPCPSPRRLGNPLE